MPDQVKVDREELKAVLAAFCNAAEQVGRNFHEAVARAFRGETFDDQDTPVQSAPQNGEQASAAPPCRWTADEASDTRALVLRASGFTNTALQYGTHIPEELVDELEYAHAALNKVARACMAHALRERQQ